MMQRTKTRTKRWGGASVVVAALVLSACGSSGGGTSTATTVGNAAPTGSTGVNLTAVKAVVDPLTGKPSPFPVLAHLTTRPAPGSKYIFLQCGTPDCANEGQLLKPAAKELGVDLTTIDEGSTATSAQAAVAAALAAKPAGVILTAVAPQLFGGQLSKLTAAGIKLVSLAVVDGQKYGIPVNLGDNDFGLFGKIMADWVIEQKGSKANVAFFGIPELSFTPPLQAGLKQAFTTNCASCKVAYEQLPVATIGSTAPAQVVSYLRAHPKVNTVVFATEEAATGLAAALKDANLHVTTMGFAPDPSNLQDIQSGGLTAALGEDFNMAVWVAVDVLARETDGQAVTGAEAQGGDFGILTKQSITFNPAHGWIGYPDVAQRFAKVWG